MGGRLEEDIPFATDVDTPMYRFKIFIVSQKTWMEDMMGIMQEFELCCIILKLV